MSNPLILCATALLLTVIAPASYAQEPVIPIWQGVAPGSEKWTQKEVEYLNPGNEKMIRNVVSPALVAYLPERSKANGTAVIVCPGGGFRFHSWQTEGTMVAEWLRERGVAAFVLKYRLVDTGATEAEFQAKMAEFFKSLSAASSSGKPASKAVSDPATAEVVALAGEDGRQAVRVVRRRASEWGIASDRIGIMGFSAGGMVTSQAILKYDAESRPNFAAPIYGAPFDGVTVPKDAPPIFILCATDDSLMADECVRLYTQWKAAKRPAELHLYSKGGHGFGMRAQGLPIDRWIERFGDWLQLQGLLKSSSPK